MFRTLKIFISGLFVGAPLGAFLWYAFSPLLFDQVVEEQLAEAAVISQGKFRNADRAHEGAGNAVIKTFPNGTLEVQLSDFEVTNGPDLEIWLSAHPDPASSSDVSDNQWVSLGQLKGNVGNQAYVVPEGTDISIFNSVVIWCEQFGVLFSPAALTPPS